MDSGRNKPVDEITERVAMQLTPEQIEQLTQFLDEITRERHGGSLTPEQDARLRRILSLDN